jgi:SAM-dependent methyltransferase
MNDWSAGYVTEVAYTYGYYTELNPLRAILPLLSSGFAVPEVAHACELGFGQGMSINIHAAASSAHWSGNDFNPTQTAFARELQGSSGVQGEFSEEAFSSFCARADLPDFDYIGLHGIWTWISDENRKIIVDFLRRKLKPGGILYISYNTLPGWAAMVPVRDLLADHADLMTPRSANVLSRIDSALDFAERLFATNPSFVRANFMIPERLAKIKEKDKSYLAHEYFNRDWHPMTFSAMNKWLADAKLDFACSANYPDHIDVINLTPEQQKFLSDIENKAFRESVRDLMTNQQFRRDYWIKGARRLSGLEKSEKIRDICLTLTTPASDIQLKVSGTLGEADLREIPYRAFINTLVDLKPKTIKQIEILLKPNNITLPQILEAAIILGGKGHVSITNDLKLAQKLKVATDKLNLKLMSKSRSSTEIMFLASPLTGGGVAVSRLDQLLLHAYQQGHKQASDMTAYAWQIFSLQGQRFIKNGAALMADEDNLLEIKSHCERFIRDRLPVLKSLLIANP